MGRILKADRNCTLYAAGRPITLPQWGVRLPVRPGMAHWQLSGDNCCAPTSEVFMSRKIVARKSRIHGNGVFAVQPLKKGERVIQYKGRLRSHEEVDNGESGDVESGHTFLFTLNEHYVLDANYEGNDARWMNHSCAPNCEALIEEDENGDRRKDKIFIEAIRNIRAGEELTYNYGITLAERHTARLKKVWACRCGAPNCTGTMLQPKR
jgi:SET domain-containing protein